MTQNMTQNVKPPKQALETWKSFADNTGLSDEARRCHINGSSYIINCRVFHAGNSDAPLFYTENMDGMLMVGLDGYTIAPNDLVLVMSKNQKFKRILAWLVKITA